jgi:hypothetical protein
VLYLSKEWLCPNDPHRDLLLMRRLAEDG